MEVGGKRASLEGELGQVDAVADDVLVTQVSDKIIEVGSEEDPPVCKICERTGQIKEVAGFCVECYEHLCDQCYLTHPASQASSHHQLLDKSQMPRKAAKDRQSCPIHTDTRLEYYCSERDQLLCRHCKTLDHHTCQSHGLISTVCDNADETKDFDHVYTELKEIEQRISRQKTDVKRNLEGVKTNKNQVHGDIAKLKQEMYSFVDGLVDDIYKEVEGIVTTDIAIMTKVTKRNEALAVEVHDLITELEFKMKSKEKMQLFIAMKIAQHTRAMFESKVKSIDMQNRIRTYSFEPEKQLQDMLTSVQKLGQLSIECDKDENVLSTGLVVMKRSLSKCERIVAHKNDALVSKSTNEKRTCRITGIELLDEDRLAIVDQDNDSVKILSRSQKTVTQYIHLSAKPWDITKVSRNTLAVTCPRASYIQMVAIERSGTLSPGRQIRVDGKCRGVKYIDKDGGRMIVSHSKPVKLQIIDMSGAIIKDLTTDPTGNMRFKHPLHIALNADQSVIYVVDDRNHSVTGVTIDGTAVFTYRDKQFYNPRGITVGDDEEIYVCNEWYFNIHMLSCSGERIKVLIEKKEGLSYPQSIMYNSRDHTLFVGMWGIDSVQTFKLSQ